MGFSGVHTRHDALLLTHRSLVQIRTGGEVACRGFASAIATALRSAQDTLAQRKREVARAEQALASADEQSRADRENSVAEARAAMARAERAVRDIARASSDFAAVQRRHTQLVADLSAKGQSKLRSLDADLDQFLAGSGGTGDGGGLMAGSNAGGMASGGSGGGVSPLGTLLVAHGLQMVDVASVDFSDNPITNWDRGSKADYRWAVEQWDTAVAPLLARGGTREDLAARDAASGADPMSLRCLAKVYDVFFGSEPIGVEPRSDGTYAISTGGRHRLYAASELGVKQLPMKIFGGRE